VIAAIRETVFLLTGQTIHITKSNIRVGSPDCSRGPNCQPKCLSWFFPDIQVENTQYLAIDYHILHLYLMHFEICSKSPIRRSVIEIFDSSHPVVLYQYNSILVGL